MSSCFGINGEAFVVDSCHDGVRLLVNDVQGDGPGHEYD